MTKFLSSYRHPRIYVQMNTNVRSLSVLCLFLFLARPSEWPCFQFHCPRQIYPMDPNPSTSDLLLEFIVPYVSKVICDVQKIDWPVIFILLLRHPRLGPTSHRRKVIQLLLLLLREFRGSGTGVTMKINQLCPWGQFGEGTC